MFAGPVMLCFVSGWPDAAALPIPMAGVLGWRHYRLEHAIANLRAARDQVLALRDAQNEALRLQALRCEGPDELGLPVPE